MTKQKTGANSITNFTLNPIRALMKKGLLLPDDIIVFQLSSSDEFGTRVGP
jgi:hypothetical protein